MLNVIDYGPVNSATMALVLAKVPSTGCKVILPPGNFSFTSPIVISTPGTTLEGECGPHPFPGMAATQLNFPANVNGVSLLGQRSCLKGLCIVNTPTNLGIITTGITLAASRCVIENCSAMYFETGCSIGGTNTNLCKLENCSFMFNSYAGVTVNGSNANAGLFENVNCENNGVVGMIETNTLGNTYVACHTSANNGKPYLVNGPSAFSTLLGCYSEGGEEQSWFGQKCLVVGGDHGAGINNGTYNGQYPGTYLSCNGYGLHVNLEGIYLTGIQPPTTGVANTFIPIATFTNGQILGWYCVSATGPTWIQTIKSPTA
jgi:hypothetical protein